MRVRGARVPSLVSLPTPNACVVRINVLSTQTDRSPNFSYSEAKSAVRREQKDQKVKKKKKETCFFEPSAGTPKVLCGGEGVNDFRRGAVRLV